MSYYNKPSAIRGWFDRGYSAV